MIKFNEEEKLKSVNGALALRPRINQIVDDICSEGYQNICWFGIGGTYASALQAEVHMKERSEIDTWAENASVYYTTGNRRITDQTLVIISSVSGTTDDMVRSLKKLKTNCQAKVLAFIDKGEDTPIGHLVDYVISYPENEQLKFFMVADRIMFNAGEFDRYEDLYTVLDQYLAQALVDVAKESESFALDFAQRHHEDPIHYFVGAGNQYGATYSYAMCYWEEQHWLRTKSIHSAEFFHGMFEIVERDTNVTLFIGEDSQRELSQRVEKFLPRVCARYTVIDTAKFSLNGIPEEFRGDISHLVMMEVCHRIDAHIERINCHPTEIRRYYRQLDY
ncbi:SIS domain-containing protein [Aerococcus sanguinicola]|uniref:SIS domain-containing protein n=1 Tax=Aerococcus sanguinicola TaxID=119206 RepID=UPI0025508D66|nr:SIS domain-containing protein [Aerococcus sanguinicola]MDK7050104.1 SIS domain-containing protein [Aerococcus sanguinicola]